MIKKKTDQGLRCWWDTGSGFKVLGARGLDLMGLRVKGLGSAGLDFRGCRVQRVGCRVLIPSPRTGTSSHRMYV